MEELQDLIFNAWARVEQKIAQDPTELDRRLALRKRPVFRRPIRPWCLAIRASDRRITQYFGWHENWQGWEGRQDIDVTAKLLRQLAMPLQTDRPYSTEKEMAHKLGRSRAAMWSIAKRGVFQRRSIHLLGGVKSHVPVIYSKHLLDPCAKKLAFPHWAWATQHAWLCERVPPHFEQTLQRIPRYIEFVPHPLTGPRRRPRDPFSRNWTQDGDYIPDNWELKRDQINARVRERYWENRQELLDLGTLKTRPLRTFCGWLWICPRCEKVAAKLYLPLFAVKAFRLLGDRDPVIGSETGMPTFEERFLCSRCHHLQYVRNRNSVTWNLLVMHASGGLLRGSEVPRPSWFPRATSARTKRRIVRREELLRRLLLGQSIVTIAREIDEPEQTLRRDLRLHIYPAAGVKTRRALLRACNVPPPPNPTRAKVLSLMAQGLRTRQIAHRLDVTFHAVTAHQRALYRQASAHSRRDLLRFHNLPPLPYLTPAEHTGGAMRSRR